MSQFGQALMNVGGYLLNRSAEERKSKQEQAYQAQVDAQKMALEERKMALLEKLRESQITASNAAAERSRAGAMKDRASLLMPKRYQGGDTMFEDVYTLDENGNPTGVKTTSTKLNPLMAPAKTKWERTVKNINGVPTIVEYEVGNPTNQNVIGEAPPKGTPEKPRIKGRTLDSTVSYWDRAIEDARTAKERDVPALAQTFGITASDRATLVQGLQNLRDADVEQFSAPATTTPQATSQKASGGPLMGALEGVKALGSKVVQGVEQMTPDAQIEKLYNAVGSGEMSAEAAVASWKKMFPGKSISLTDPKTGKQVVYDASKPPVPGAQKDDSGNWWVLDEGTGKYRQVFEE